MTKLRKWSGGFARYEKNTYESALRTRCAERTRAMLPMQLAAFEHCVHLEYLHLVFMGLCVWSDMEVQV